jgi:Condensation domain
VVLRGGAPVTAAQPPAAEVLPLSAGQEALWFAYTVQPDSPAYNVGIAVRVRGQMDISSLLRAVAAVCGRHDLLRSIFTEVAGQPKRLVYPAGLARLTVRDLGTAAEFAAAAREELTRPFRLRTELPFRVALLRSPGDGAVLLISAHHIVTDADSQLFLLRDILDSYLALQAGEQPRWQPLPCSYGDYVRAERELLASPRAAAHESFWRTACDGAQLALALPTDFARPSAQRFTGAQHEFCLTDDQRATLRTAARGMGVTVFAYLLGAFQALLYRYTAQRDFLIGYVTTTRQRSTRQVVGYFINSLPIRASIGPSSTPREIIAAASGGVRAGIAHRDFPLPQIAQALGVPRDPGRLSMFNVLFSMVVAYPPDPLFDLTSMGGELPYGGLTLTRFDIPQQEGQFDVTVDMIESKSSITGVIKYNTDLFTPEKIETLGRHFVRMLTAAAEDPDGPVAGVCLADPAEQAKLLALASGS